ncbi:MAG: hypothetical protein WKF61_00600 [Luteimonas sp.]
MKFRKKPVVIEAFHNSGSISLADFPAWAIEAVKNHSLKLHDGGIFSIITLEGAMTASPNDWIIQGVSGEIYPCKPDIFAATYEAVEI